jgi:hypothetical protein
MEKFQGGKGVKTRKINFTQYIRVPSQYGRRYSNFRRYYGSSSEFQLKFVGKGTKTLPPSTSGKQTDTIFSPAREYT